MELGRWGALLEKGGGIVMTTFKCRQSKSNELVTDGHQRARMGGVRTHFCAERTPLITHFTSPANDFDSVTINRNNVSSRRPFQERLCC